MKTYKKLPSKYRSVLPLITQLVAEKPLSKIAISRKFALPINGFVNYREFNEAYQLGIDMFSEKVFDVLNEQMVMDSKVALRYFEKLKLLQPEPIELVKIVDTKTARECLSMALVLYAEGKLNEAQLAAIRTAADSYSALTVNDDIAERLGKLETLLENHNVKK